MSQFFFAMSRKGPRYFQVRMISSKRIVTSDSSLSCIASMRQPRDYAYNQNLQKSLRLLRTASFPKPSSVQIRTQGSQVLHPSFKFLTTGPPEPCFPGPNRRTLLGLRGSLNPKYKDPRSRVHTRDSLGARFLVLRIPLHPQLWQS